MQNKINQILEISADEKYVVLNQAIYKENSYLLLCEVDEEAEELSDEVIIVKEIVEDENVSIEEVEDPELLELLIKYLSPEE